MKIMTLRLNFMTFYHVFILIGARGRGWKYHLIRYGGEYGESPKTHLSGLD